MSARTRILSRIRRAQAGEADPAAREAAVRARLGAAGAQSAPIPARAQVSGAEAVAQFEERLAAADATSARLPDWSALPGALAEALRARNLARAIRMGAEPAFADLDWSGLETSRGPGRIEEPATLSRAVCGVAETGTLALRSGPENPVTLTFLGETHFIAVRAADVVGGLEDMWARIRASGATPRTVNLVTGPSRSADIGQVLQLGAHGPVALHVFVIED
jgi:L-lactate utilization protein LutC